jgi:hypothetical protein
MGPRPWDFYVTTKLLELLPRHQTASHTMPFASEAATTWGLGEGGERRPEKCEDREAYQRWKETLIGNEVQTKFH